ncbi:MAG: CBS domain-containing protein, partial [Alphaproteobacteria bacterium]
GRLGRVLLRVSDIMHGADELPLCGPEASMADALIVMTNKRFGCVGIVDRRGALIGVVTDGDLRRHMNAGLLQQPAGDVMTAQPRTIRPQALAAEALGLMNAASITSLFVVDAGRPLGIIHIHDCLRAGVA